MKLKKMLILIFIIILICLRCNTTEPPVDNLQPGRRDYMWTVDTLNYPFDTIYRIWGSSPTDVWATSSGDWDKSISHFNSEKWSSYGISGMDTPHSVFGFTYNNIYVGTAGGGIWRFDGSSWNKFAELTKDGHNDIVFDNLWGESPTDFYAFGAYPDSNGAANNSVIAHYLNSKWTMLNTSAIKGIVEHLYKDKNDGKVYLQAIKIGGAVHPDSTIIYEYLQEKFNKLYSSVWTKGLQADISLINNEVYFVLGNKIAKRVNDEFQTFLQIDNPNFYQRIWGRTAKDIFLFMLDGLVHYNGSDMEYLLHFDKPRTHIFGSALFDKEVFFLVYESSTNLNLIYHGKLN